VFKFTDLFLCCIQYHVNNLEYMFYFWFFMFHSYHAHLTFLSFYECPFFFSISFNIFITVPFLEFQPLCNFWICFSWLFPFLTAFHIFSFLKIFSPYQNICLQNKTLSPFSPRGRLSELSEEFVIVLVRFSSLDLKVCEQGQNLLFKTWGLNTDKIPDIYIPKTQKAHWFCSSTDFSLLFNLPP
jgi:hypothetical protein